MKTTKKLISLCLAIVLLFSGVLAIGVSAADQQVMTATQFITYLKKAMARNNKYGYNHPYNVGYYDGETISWDCWNLGKSILWSRGAIVDNYTVGNYERTNSSIGLGDWDGLTIVKKAPNCGSDFTALIPGEWLYLDGHTGYYIGDGQVIECTQGWGVNRIVQSQIDAAGHRSFNGQGGGKWLYHGMVPWIDYSDVTGRGASSGKSTDEIVTQINSTYSEAKRRANVSSFNGYCAWYVNYVLLILGINSSYVGGNGNQEFDNYKGLSKSSGGYSVTAYPASSYNLKSALNAIASGGNAYNILVGFEKGAGDDGALYGHTCFIHAIIDGKVYYAESFRARPGGTYYNEGTPIVCSIDEFCNYYNSWATLDGVIHFGGTGGASSPSYSATPASSVFSSSTPKSSYTTAEDVIIQWTSKSGASYYGLTIVRKTGDSWSSREVVYDKDYLTGNSVNVGKLGVGEYRFNMGAYDGGYSLLGGYSQLSYFNVTQAAVSKVYLDVNGSLNGSAIGSLEGFGTCDVYINGAKVADDVEDYYTAWPVGTTYEIKDIQPEDGYSYDGATEGSLSGSLGSSDANIRLAFSDISRKMMSKAKEKTYGGHTYRYYATPVTWYEAAYFCEREGGHLATIEDEDENDFVESLMKGDHLWIGATDRVKEGTWRWVTGKKMAYSNWASGEPNNVSGIHESEENYAHMCADGTWNDTTGAQLFPFVMEIDSVEKEEPVYVAPTPAKTTQKIVKVTQTARGGIRVEIDGDSVRWSDVQPFTDSNDRIQVPLRTIANAMGLIVGWDSESRVASFSNGRKTLYFPIGIARAWDDDDTSIKMDTAATIQNDRTYAPVRYLAEYFGYTVEWNDGK